ncbi:unnamed protein product [Dovyalis caffra]|uniref:Uncharacterized protein n=1 Tax=Dovyalis caffra TaxID=77055 RepID=A0AAV1QPP5_9ROSI|nr:unnamed protein product [Dovyalis caffra]
MEETLAIKEQAWKPLRAGKPPVLTRSWKSAADGFGENERPTIATLLSEATSEVSMVVVVNDDQQQLGFELMFQVSLLEKMMDEGRLVGMLVWIRRNFWPKMNEASLACLCGGKGLACIEEELVRSNRGGGCMLVWRKSVRSSEGGGRCTYVKDECLVKWRRRRVGKKMKRVAAILCF